MSYLSDWHDLLQKQAQKKLQDDAARAENMRKELPIEIARLPSLSDEDLLDRYSLGNPYIWEPVVAKIYQEYLDAIKSEILVRMSR